MKTPEFENVHNQDQLLAILSEIDEARAQIRPLLVEYPRVLKQWAEAEKMVADHYFKLGEVIVDMHSQATIDESHLMTVMSATAASPNTQGVWKKLVELAAQWDLAIRRLSKANMRYVAFRAYEDNVGKRPQVLDVLRPYAVDDEEDDINDEIRRDRALVSRGKQPTESAPGRMVGPTIFERHQRP
jgi:hypothetical protein